MRCGGKEEKSVQKSLGMVIYAATLLLSQSARALWDRSGVAVYITIPGDFQTLFSLLLLFLIVHHTWHDQYCRNTLATEDNCTVRVKLTNIAAKSRE